MAKQFWPYANNKDADLCSLISVSVIHSGQNNTVKIQKILTPEKFAVIALEFKQDGFTIE